MKQEITNFINETMKQNYIDEIDSFKDKTIKSMIPETIDKWVFEFTDGTSASIISSSLDSKQSILLLESIVNKDYIEE